MVSCWLHLGHCLSFNLYSVWWVIPCPVQSPTFPNTRWNWSTKWEFQCTQQSRIWFWPCPVYNAAHTRAVGNGSSLHQCYIGSYHALTKGVNTNWNNASHTIYTIRYKNSHLITLITSYHALTKRTNGQHQYRQIESMGGQCLLVKFSYHIGTYNSYLAYNCIPLISKFITHPQ